MELFVQQVLGTVSLNDHVDEMHEYYRCFSGWVARQRKNWMAHNVLPAAIYHVKIRQQKTKGDRIHLLETPEGLAVSDNLLPWLVFGCHVLLDYSTDVKVISKFLSRAGFQLLPDDLIADIVAWSSYPARLTMAAGEQEFCSRVFSLLESSGPDFFPYCKSGYIKHTWQLLYNHHLRTPSLNNLVDQAGIVYFGLVRIEKSIYSVVFMDAMTEAVEFSDLITTHRDFKNPREFDRMSQEVSDCICAFLKKYGHPRFLVLVNPLSNWLYYVLSRAVKHLWVPTHTEFVAPVQKSDTEPLVLQKVEPFLSVIAYVLYNRDISEIPPFKHLKSEDSSWRLTFATNIHWAQNQVFSYHPKTLSDMLSPRLIVAEIPGLNLVKADPITFRMLKTKPPKRFNCGDCPLSSATRLDKASSEVFQELMKKSEQFSLSAGQKHANILIDNVTEKVLVYLYELREAEKQGVYDVATVMRQSKLTFQSMNEDDLFWISHGVEIMKNGSFGPAEAFNGNRSEFIDPKDTSGRQFHLARETKQLKREVKDETEIDSDEEIIEEEPTAADDSDPGAEPMVDDAGASVPALDLSLRRTPRRAAEIAAVKVRQAYERYKKVRRGVYIDREAPETEEDMVFPTVRNPSPTASPAKKRKVDFGAHFKQLRLLGEIGKEMSASMGDEAVDGDADDHMEDKNVNMEAGEGDGDEDEETHSVDGEEGGESESGSESGSESESESESGSGSEESASGSRQASLSEHSNPLNAEADRMLVPESPPFEDAERIIVAEQSSPLFERAGPVVAEPGSPRSVEPVPVVVPSATPSSSTFVKDEPFSPPAMLKLEPTSPKAHESSPDVLAAYSEDFSYLEITDDCPVQKMVDEDVRNHPDAEYSVKPIRFRGTQYPDGKLAYSSDSESDYDSMDGGYSDIDFGVERAERKKQRREQVEYTHADFQLSENDEEWTPLQPGDLEKVYNILKWGCEDHS